MSEINTYHRSVGKKVGATGAATSGALKDGAEPASENYNASSEADFYSNLQNRLKKDQKDRIQLEISMTNSYPDIEADFKKIDDSDCQQFIDGIDTESVSYKYCNSLNQFRYDQAKKIDMQKEVQQTGAVKEARFIQCMEKNHIALPAAMFDENFDFANVFSSVDSQHAEPK